MDNKDTALLIIDVQERFVPVISDMDKVIDNTIKLIRSFQILGSPIIVTEQYPKGLGYTVEHIKKELKDYRPIEKIHFNCFDEKSFKVDKAIKNLVICGIEAHVCVTQTLLSAIKKGFDAYLVKDAVSSRHEEDKDIAIGRAKQEGAKIVSTEMVIFEMLKKARTAQFKKIQNIIR